MKKIILGLVLLISGSTMAQYKPVEQGSALKFTVSNLGFNVNGTFSGFQGNISFDAQNPSAGSFDVTIDAGTVNTDNTLRDEHLKGEGYFEVKSYPRIHLVSAKVSKGKGGAYLLTAHLTIKNQTKDVSFPFTAQAADDGYIFKGSFKINRKDFEVGGTSTIANELEVNLNVHAVKA